MTFKRATPPNTPNAVDGTSSPALPDPVGTTRMTVRLEPDTADRLGELEWRLMQYILTKEQYQPEVQTIKTIVLPVEQHKFIAEQAAAARMTINAFIAKLLADKNLAPVSPGVQPPPTFHLLAAPNATSTASGTFTHVHPPIDNQHSPP